jgi:hypothetical protein
MVVGRNQSLVVSRRSHWKADARVARRALFLWEEMVSIVLELLVAANKKEHRILWKRATGLNRKDFRKQGRWRGGGVVRDIVGGVDSPEEKTDVKQAQTNASRCRKLRRPLEWAVPSSTSLARQGRRQAGRQTVTQKLEDAAACCCCCCCCCCC